MATQRRANGTDEHRNAASCPGCLRWLRLSHDMWGPYWVCEDCGFAAEEDEAAAVCVASPVFPPGANDDRNFDRWPKKCIWVDRQGRDRIMTERHISQPNEGAAPRRPLRPPRQKVPDEGVVVADDLPPALRRRVRSLLSDLAADDISMALLDLANLYRSVAGITGEALATVATESAEQQPVLIFGEDGETVAEVCNGPGRSGACPRALRGDHVVCADRWLMASAWMFKVAPDAVLCPLVPLGLTPAPQSALAGTSRARTIPRAS